MAINKDKKSTWGTSGPASLGLDLGAGIADVLLESSKFENKQAPIDSAAYRFGKGFTATVIGGQEQAKEYVHGAIYDMADAISYWSVDKEYRDLANLNYGLSALNNGLTKIAGAGASIGLSPGMASVMGAAEAVAPGASETVARGYSSLQEKIGGVSEWTQVNLDKQAQLALGDLVIGLGVLGGIGKASKYLSKKEGQGLGLNEGLVESPLDSGIAITDNFIKGVEAKVNEVGRPLNKQEVTEVYTSVTGETPKLSSRVDVSSLDEAIPEETKVFSILDDKLGSRTNISKKSESAIIQSLVDEAGLSQDKATQFISDRIVENKELARLSKDQDGGIMADLRTLREANYVRKNDDNKPLSYDKVGEEVQGNALYRLEEAGIVEKSADVEAGLYQFHFTEKAKRYLSPEDYKTVSLSGGLKHYPIDMYEALGIKKATKGGVDTTPLDFDEVDRLLGRESFKGIANKKMVDDIFKEADEMLYGEKDFETPSNAFNERVRVMAERLGIKDTTYLYNWDGAINPEGLIKFVDELKAFKKMGFARVENLPIPNSLKTMLRRDSMVAKAAFSEGRTSMDDVITGLREKMARSIGEERIKYQNRIDKLNSVKAEQAGYKKSLVDTIKNISSPDSPYKFFGGKAEVDKLVSKFTNRILSTNTESGMAKVLDELEYAVEQVNISVLKDKILDELKPFLRKEGKYSSERKQIGPQERLALETAAKAWSEVKKGEISSDELADTLDVIKNIKKLGKDNFNNSRRLNKETIKEVSDNIKELGVKDAIQDVDNFEGHNIRQWFQTVYERITNPMEFLLTMVNGNTSNPLFLMFARMNELQNKILFTKNQFLQEIRSKLDEAGLLSQETMRDLGIYSLLKQGDWDYYVYRNRNGKIQLDENGNKIFTGHRIFKGKEFSNEAEYLLFVNEMKKKIEGNDKLLEVYNYSRKLYDETYDKAAAATLIHDGVILGKVPNYYAGRPLNVRVPDFGEFTPDKGWRKGWQMEREGGKQIQFDPDFQADTLGFLDKELRYAEMIGQYQMIKDVMNSGALSNLSRTNFEIVNKMAQDYTRGGVLESSPFSRASSFFSKNILALAITTILSQPLAILDASLYTSAKGLKEATKLYGREKYRKYAGKALNGAGAYNHMMDYGAIDRAINSSMALKTAMDFDYQIAEVNKASYNNKFLRGAAEVTDRMMIPLAKVDFGTKVVTWMAAYSDKFKEVTGKDFDWNNPQFTNKEAILHADAMMQLAIGSKDPVFAPPTLRSATGRAILTLQSFVVRRFGQITHRLPEVYKKDKAKASAVLATLAATTVMQAMISPMWNEFMESIGAKDEKDFFERVSGKKGATQTDAIVALGEKLITSNVPGYSNVKSIMSYDQTGYAPADAIKQSLNRVGAVGTALSTRTPKGKPKERQYRRATMEAFGALTPYFGGYPTRALYDYGKKKVTEREKTPEYKRKAAEEKRRIANER